jgi:hypothetical protein
MILIMSVYGLDNAFCESKSNPVKSAQVSKTGNPLTRKGKGGKVRIGGAVLQ